MKYLLNLFSLVLFITLTGYSDIITISSPDLNSQKELIKSSHDHLVLKNHFYTEGLSEVIKKHQFKKINLMNCGVYRPFPEDVNIKSFVGFSILFTDDVFKSIENMQELEELKLVGFYLGKMKNENTPILPKVKRLSIGLVGGDREVLLIHKLIPVMCPNVEVINLPLSNKFDLRVLAALKNCKHLKELKVPVTLLSEKIKKALEKILPKVKIIEQRNTYNL
jgi:hypothetical protein